MTRYRIINAIFWLYLWLSDVMQPVVSEGDFWSEKATQLLRLNQNFDDPPRLIGNAIIPVVLWFVIDLWLRRKRKRVELSKKEEDNWTDAERRLSFLEHKRRSKIGLTREEVTEEAHRMTRVDAFTYGAEGEARKRLADLEKQARWARENRRRLKPKAKKDLRLLRVLFGRPSTFATDPEDDPIHPLCNTKPANDGNLYPYNSKLRPPPIWIDEDGVAIADQPKVVYDDSSSWPYTALDPRHVDYVARQPCLVCGGGPAHVYYLRFTEELARKVSDEYTVPLCGDHLDELRTVGDEAMWWMRTGVEPVGVARMLWRVTHPEVTAAQLRDPAEGRLMRSRRLAFYAALAANHAASVPPQPSNDKSAAPPAAC